MANLLAGLPEEIRKKINKTKQTRGAQPRDRVAYQNRVKRNGVAVVPFAFRDRLHPDGFENGYRIMVRPQDYFGQPGVRREDFDQAVAVGQNGFLYYDNREQWATLPPPRTWTVAKDRGGSGHYIARVPATTAAPKIVRGAPQGIRFFEYASSSEIERTVAQLAWLAWHTEGIERQTTSEGPSNGLLDFLQDGDLANVERLEGLGALTRANSGWRCTCPLCLKPITALELMTRVKQVAGREVVDLTITEANLFHLEDLRPGEYNHRAYAVAWGHHHCNAVARDSGVPKTLDWMEQVLRRHGRLG